MNLRGTILKKRLSRLWHQCPCGVGPAQRDLYSTYLARHVENGILSDKSASEVCCAEEDGRKNQANGEMNRHRYPSKETLAKNPDFPLSVQKTILAMGLMNGSIISLVDNDSVLLRGIFQTPQYVGSV